MAEALPLASEMNGLPRYREAYPQLDIMRATAAFNRGHTICEFKDRWGDVHGIARFNLREDRCQVEYDLNFSYIEPRSGWTHFELKPSPNEVAPKRAMLLCPSCKQQKKILFYKDTWSCAFCLKFLFRTQLIGSSARKWERFDELHEQLRHGRPHGMHNSKYGRLLVELDKRRSRIYGTTRCFASNKYSRLVNSFWRSRERNDDLFFQSSNSFGPFGKVKPIDDDRHITQSVSMVFDERDYVEVVNGYETSNPHEL